MWKKVAFKNLFLASVVIDVVAALAVVILENFLPPVLPLFFGLPTGETQLVGRLGLLIAPAAAFLLTILNLNVSLLTHDQFLKKILAVSALVVSVLIVITILKIILLVGFF